MAYTRWKYKRGCEGKRKEPPNGHWYACYLDEHGERRQVGTKARTRTEAQKDAEDLERKASRVLRGLEEGALEPTLFSALVEERLRVVTRNQRSAKNTEIRIRKHLLPVFGSKFIHRIRPSEMEALLAEKARGEKPLSAQTRKHLRNDLNALFNFAIKRMRVLKGENPVAHVPQVKVPRKRPRSLTVEQAQRLLEKAGSRRFILVFAILTGLRKGEICGLKWADLDLPHRVIHVSRSYANDTTKGGQPRVVAVHRELVPLLEAERARAKSPYVFPGEDGQMRRFFNGVSVLRAAMKEAGIVEAYVLSCRRQGCKQPKEESSEKVQKSCPKCGFALWCEPRAPKLLFKDLRSTFGTLAYEATGNIRFVQEQLGHSDDRITREHYASQRVQHLIAQTDLIALGASRDSPHAAAEGTQSKPKPS